MSCHTFRTLLPGAAYGDLSTEEAARLEAHLRHCPACQEELAALRRVQQQLANLPAPEVQVDLPRLYHQASRRTVRRWQRWALASAGVAAALFLGLLALRLEVRVTAHELVLRWGTPLPEAVPPPPPPEAHQPVLAAPGPAAPGTEEKLRLLSDLVIALARDVEDRDGERKEELARLRAQLVVRQRQAADRLAATERDVAALYTVHFNHPDKGADR